MTTLERVIILHGKVLQAGKLMSRYKIYSAVLVFSILLSYILINGPFFLHNGPADAFKHAKWITGNSSSDIQYFRKTFYLEEKVKNAWLTVSATDRYEVYINGKIVGKEVKDGWYPAKIYDVTDRLKTGRNVLSLKTQLRKFEDKLKVIAEVGYETYSDKIKYIYTGKGWKTADYKNILSPSGLDWYEIDFNDSHWSGAGLISGPGKFILEEDPKIYQTGINNGQWFWAGTNNQITCFCNLEIPSLPRSAWTRISSWGDFKIGINGDEIDSVYGNINSDSKKSSLPVNKILYVYNLTGELNKGQNSILITSYSSTVGRGVYIDGLIEGDGWSKELTANDFECINSDGTAKIDKVYLDPGAGNLGQKILKNSFNNNSLKLSGVFKSMFLALVFAAILLLFTFLISRKSNVQVNSLTATYMLPTLYLLSLIFLSFNIHYGSYGLFDKWPAIVSIIILILLWMVLILFKKERIGGINSKAVFVLLIFILFAALFLRIQHINTEGLHWDEAQMSEKVGGVFERGYPSLEFSDNTPRYIATSELLVYIQSISVSLFGQNLFSLRLPSLLFGILTVILLFYFGKLVSGYRVGILSSTAYAVFPPAIGMSVFARYPSQLTFFSLLSAYLLIKYINTKRLKYWITCMVSLVFSYYSWQASLFMALPLVLSRFFFIGRKKIIRDAAFLFLILCMPVFVHIILKKLSRLNIENYSLLGPSLSLTSIKFNFLDSLYEPFFYIDNFLFVEGFHFFTFFFFAGIPLLFLRAVKRRELFILYIIMISVFFVMTSVLANNSYRYAFYLTPFLIVIAGTVFINLLDLLYRSDKLTGINNINLVFAFIFFVFFSTGAASFHKFPYYREGLKTNLKLRNFPDFKKASVFLNQGVKEDDVVISMVPHLNNYYFSKLDYFFESRLQVAVFKNFEDGNLSAYHKVVPIPAVLSLGELKNIIYSTRGNVWLIGSPERYKLFDNDTIDFLENNRTLVFESFETKIYLMNK